MKLISICIYYNLLFRDELSEHNDGKMLNSIARYKEYINNIPLGPSTLEEYNKIDEDASKKYELINLRIKYKKL